MSLSPSSRLFVFCGCSLSEADVRSNLYRHMFHSRRQFGSLVFLVKSAGSERGFKLKVGEK